MVEKGSSSEAAILSQDGLCLLIEFAGFRPDYNLNPNLLQEGTRVFRKGERAYAVNPDGLVGWQHRKNQESKRQHRDFNPAKSAMEDLNRKIKRTEEIFVNQGAKAREDFIIREQVVVLESLRYQMVTRARSQTARKISGDTITLC